MSDVVTLEQAIGLGSFYVNADIYNKGNRQSRRNYNAAQFKALRAHVHQHKLNAIRFAVCKPRSRKVAPLDLFRRTLSAHCPVWQKILGDERVVERDWHQIAPFVFREPNVEWRKLQFRVFRALQFSQHTGRWAYGYWVTTQHKGHFVEAADPRSALKASLSAKVAREYRILRRYLILHGDLHLTYADAKRVYLCESGVYDWCYHHRLPLKHGQLLARFLIPYLDDHRVRQVIAGVMKTS
jgi:hypothetical protein